MTLDSYLHNATGLTKAEWKTADPEKIETAVQWALSDSSPLCWRAAWLLGSCMSDNDPRITPHVNRILEVLPDKEAGHQRELIKILQRMDLSESQQSALYDHCVHLWESVRVIPSLRHTAFRVMVTMTKIYPELSHEVLALTQHNYVHPLSPGIRNSVRKLIADVEKSIFSASDAVKTSRQHHFAP